MNENKDQKTISFKKLVTENKWYFSVNFFIILLITFSFLYLFNLVPDELKTIVGREPVKESTVVGQVGELPLSIKIPTVGINVQVYNPQSTSTSILDSYLLKGVVRYPGSGLLGGDGNMFVFGHSTGIKVVNNQAFKAFNGLKNLKEGEIISVFSEKYEYTYKVLTVKMVGAEEALVTFNTKSRLLTLSTCNTFGAKSDRYVVEAEFVSKKSII